MLEIRITLGLNIAAFFRGNWNFFFSLPEKYCDSKKLRLKNFTHILRCAGWKWGGGGEGGRVLNQGERGVKVPTIQHKKIPFVAVCKLLKICGFLVYITTCNMKLQKSFDKKDQSVKFFQMINCLFSMVLRFSETYFWFCYNPFWRPGLYVSPPLRGWPGYYKITLIKLFWITERHCII